MPETNQLKPDTTKEPEIGFTWWEIYGLLNITLGNGFLAFGLNLPPTTTSIAIAINTATGVGILLNSRMAFLAATVLSLNPLVWIINGIYLNNRWSHPRVNPQKKTNIQNSTIKQRWWRADQNFRLAVLACALWIVGSFFTQDGYRIDYKIIFLPPLLLFVGYFGHQLFVVPPTHRANVSTQQPDDQPASTSSAPLAKETNSYNVQKTPAERNRSMVELIERMKK